MGMAAAMALVNSNALVISANGQGKLKANDKIETVGRSSFIAGVHSMIVGNIRISSSLAHCERRRFFAIILQTMFFAKPIIRRQMAAFAISQPHRPPMLDVTVASSITSAPRRGFSLDYRFTTCYLRHIAT